jgi:hypothetical protein
MDGAGVLYHDKDPIRIAALIDRIATDRRLSDAIVASQDAALDRLHAKDFSRTLLGFVEQVRQTPRRPHRPVAFDFWEQVRELDSLDELRPFRPGAFLALPKAGGAEPAG